LYEYSTHDVCHRDLKSANVLFNRQLQVKLCDFAFSKFRQAAAEIGGDAGKWWTLCAVSRW